MLIWALRTSTCICFFLDCRISLSDNKYRVIRLPTEDGRFYLGKSVEGIYCASLFQKSQLQIWFLNVECGHDQTGWVLKHNRDILPILPNLNYDQQCEGPWRHEQDSDVGDNEAIVEEKMGEKFEWDSDNDNVLEHGGGSKDSHIVFLGFHPYKEAVLLSDKFERVLAYNWSSSKLQGLGQLFSKIYSKHDHLFVSASFPYTPCWLGELPEKQNLEAHQLQV